MESQNPHTLITIVGPTSIGKTSLSIALARHFNTEILSADSRQFFKEMEIGTAVPEAHELAAAKHHFIQHKSIHEPYNVGDFERDALALLDARFMHKNPLILVGGSGLYVDAVLKGLDKFPTVDPSIRQTLKTRLATTGLASLQAELKRVDPVSYAQIDLENHQRLIRALEVSIGTGQPFSSYLAKEKVKRKFNYIKIGLTADRSIIYDRINLRVDQMIEKGLVNEARALYPLRELNALQTVGYRELFRYFTGEISLDFAIDEIKKNTRRFAKRQITWYRKDEDILWFPYDTPVAEIIHAIDKI
ncbi:tRNA (adenosine(37)-N6)-dimethylallyltransferase MiaA [Flavobacteriaceae bacterium F08102]|nr:tRNA (adenosine(37)-N6)-dimethylallyltransferase MiaA [Flavobacteriaceae bacterium F08102]